MILVVRLFGARPPAPRPRRAPRARVCSKFMINDRAPAARNLQCAKPKAQTRTVARLWTRIIGWRWRKGTAPPAAPAHLTPPGRRDPHPAGRGTTLAPRLPSGRHPDDPVRPDGAPHLSRGRSNRFQPSLKGRSACQTASTRVEELSIRYMRPFRTSLTDIYSYGTTVHMSILSCRFMRLVRIMPTSRLARATADRTDIMRT